MKKELTVTVYGHDACPPCKTVKAMLDYKGIPYIYRNVLEEPKYLNEMMYHSDNQRIFPVVVTDKGTMIGYSPSRLTEILL